MFVAFQRKIDGENIARVLFK